MKEILITKNEHNQRLDRFLKKLLPKASLGFIYKMLRKKRIKLNNNRANPNDIVNAGDKVQFYLSLDTIESFQNVKDVEDIPLTLGIIYEDSNILLLNKPKGLLSHSASVKDDNTVVKQLISYLHMKGEYMPSEENTFTPAICNRLDRNTSGIIIAGKNHVTLQIMNEVIKEDKIKKIYRCIVKGTFYNRQELKDYIVKDTKKNTVSIYRNRTSNSKKIHTIIKPLKTKNNYSFLEVEIKTGRSHQIRAHLASIGHPIIGDTKYGDRCVNDFFRKEYNLRTQFLHGYKIKFLDVKPPLEYLNNQEFTAEMGEKLNYIVKDLF